MEGEKIREFTLAIAVAKIWQILFVKWGAPTRWSFRPHSIWASKETTTIEKTRPTLLNRYIFAVIPSA